jgi:hypothetical protein
MALARRLSTATSCSSSVAPHFVISEEARIRDRLLGGRSPSERRLFRRKAYRFSPSKRTRRRMSKIGRHSDFTPSPSPHEQRILNRVLGCGVEELVAQLGAKNAKRGETELQRAKLARSRKLHTLWSDVLVRIEADTGVRRNPMPPRSTRRIASSGNDAGPEG